MVSIVINSTLQNTFHSELKSCSFAAMKTLKVHGVKNVPETLKTFFRDSHAVRKHVILTLKSVSTYHR